MGRWRASSSSLLLKQIKLTSQSFLFSSSFPSSSSSSSSFLLKSTQQQQQHIPISKQSSWGFRFLSANPCPSPIYDNDFIDGVHEFSQNYEEEKEKVEKERVTNIPVKAYFLSTSIDLKSMQAEYSCNVIPPTSRSSSNYIALRYFDFPFKVAGTGGEEIGSCWRYMVVFQYGSAVLFNIEEDEVDSYLELVRRHASGLLSEMRKDDYAVKEKPLLKDDMQGGPDYIVLKSLDIDGIRIIGSVLGQSIALDYFVSQVDGMVEVFTDINRDMEKTGNFTMRRKKLFQLVGKANSNLADVILKVGLFDR
ncbi:hypothetical protein AQUCO_00600473v1 [Aquilegia coerulea]|nr:hypothetical protein AQUCO_00600473v1 [Aquilegia coerulea]